MTIDKDITVIITLYKNATRSDVLAAEKLKMDYLQDSDSASQDNDSESECPTEM
jgi:hypothetical protein